MIPTVHILATCRQPELFRATTLVFDSLRTGLPTFPVQVTGNDLEGWMQEEVEARCRETGAEYRQANYMVHHEWITGLIQTERTPFWIVDTDVVFWRSMEGFEFKGPITGRFVPRFRCPFTRTMTHERLHTAVMRVDPVVLRRSAIRNRPLDGDSPFLMDRNLIAPLMYPLNGEWYHHDTMGQLYHLIGGEKFSETHLNCFDHLNAGTYADLMEKRVPGFQARQQQQISNPKSIRGLWRKQDEYYRANAA